MRDGKILLYTRNNRPTYHCRLKIDGRKGYIVKSTKEKNLASASKFAEELFDDLKYKQRHGLEIDYFLFKRLWREWFEKNKISLSMERQRYHEGTANRYFIPFFGEKEVSSLKDSDFDDYWVWRIDYWNSITGQQKIDTAKNQRPTKKNPHKSKLGNVAKIPSQKSLDMEQSSLRQIMRWANNRGIINRFPQIKSPKIVKHKQITRRPAFTRQEWSKIEMSLTHKCEEKSEKQPRTKGVFAKTKTKLKRPHKLHKYHRMLLRDYVSFMVFSGLRPNEARQLRWCDISVYKDINEDEQIQIEVAPTTKTGMRKSTPMKPARKVLERIKTYSPNTNDTDLVFCTQEGRPIQDFNKTFKKDLNELDLLTDKNGNSRTVYSLRHTYATWMLMYQNMDVYDLSKNMGCGINMIKNHYDHVLNRRKGHTFGNVVNNKEYMEDKEKADFEAWLEYEEKYLIEDGNEEDDVIA